MAVDADTSDELSAESSTDGPARGICRAAVAGLLILMAVGGVTGWLGYRAHLSDAAQRERELFLRAGRQCALNLGTIEHTRVDADIDRVLNCAAGGFHDGFQQNSAAFAEVVRASGSTSEGTVTEAAVESFDTHSASVLIAMSVRSSGHGAQHQPRLWRMRIKVERVGDEAKVSDVSFV